MRRVITLLLTVAMALSLVVVASASQTVYLRVDEEQSGNTVTYTFTLDASKCNGVGAMEFYVETTGLTYQNATYNNGGTKLDDVFKGSTGVAGPGDYRFYENQNYFIAWGGNASDGRLLKNSVVLVALTYQIDNANYKLTVKSGSFKACYSGDKAMTDPYACKVRTGDVMKGDVDGENGINIFDAMKIVQHIKGVIDLSDVPAAYVNDDEVINIFDAMMIVQHIKGAIDLTA